MIFKDCNCRSVGIFLFFMDLNGLKRSYLCKHGLVLVRSDDEEKLLVGNGANVTFDWPSTKIDRRNEIHNF